MDKIFKERQALKRIIDGHAEPSNLTLPLLRDITEGFSENRKIGNGGCGQVYKGALANRFVAVKKLFDNRTMDDRMFCGEVESMIKIKNKNIVKFLGYCSHTEQKAIEINGKLVFAEERKRLLCFEYIPNGSLENHLTDELRGLEWCTRYQIIKGICDGLCHLHKDVNIIHMDLKPANILLDSDFVAKITDFGLARLADVSHTISQDRLISLGYCAPEYQNSGQMSIKSDIYSLGVIIMELVTGSKETPSTENVLRRWRHRWNKSGNNSPLEYKQVAKCIELATRCINIKPYKRPNVWEIASELNEMEKETYVTFTNDQLSELDDMLWIEPLDLRFPFQPNKQISCPLTLTNHTKSYIAFNIQVERPHLFNAQPKKGVIAPGSMCSVTITLQAQKKVPGLKHCTDVFTVQSTTVGEGLTSMDIIKDLFSESTGKVVDKVTLTVVFDATQTPEEAKQDLPFTSAGTPPQKTVSLYTTTLSGITKTFENCNVVREALQLNNIPFVEKDLFDRPDILKELKKLTNGKPYKLPVLSINGNYICDASKLLELIDEMELANFISVS